MSLARRAFSYSDQMRFASASGDYNPMHVDALQARRTQAGAPVVHGIHLLLWALDSFAAAQLDLPPVRAMRVHFNKFVYLDEAAEAVLAQQSATGARLSISVDGVPRSKISITFGEAVDESSELLSSLSPLIPPSPAPLNPGFENMAGSCGQFQFHMKAEDAVTMFPAAAKWIGVRRIAALAASTYLVGMVCPGLHSIYSELSIKSCAEHDTKERLAFRVAETDPRFRSVEMEIAGGGLIGTIHSTARTPPVEQATMASLAGLVASGEFAGAVALIVGGSRGLGELTAKLIASGGGRVVITWQSGRDDAEKVAQEIRAAGGACETLAYDARKPAADQLASLAVAPTHAYYFATPAIFRPQAEIFSADRLKEFLAIYVDGFWELAQALRALRPRVSLFYPSSVAVAERPRGMTEYTMAKSAGEVLCADINEALSPAHVTVVRLPRLPTDQTATVAAVEAADPVETMLPIVREVQSWQR